MNICRAFWTGVVSLLLPMFPAGAAPAAVPELPKSGVLRYFHYWAEYGEEASCPGDLERIRFELQPRRIYFSQGRPSPDTFSVQTDGSLNREFVPVLASLNLADWPGQMEQRALYDLSDTRKRKLCRWHISVVFEPESPEKLPFQFSSHGADDGTSPKRLAAEHAFRAFFGPKLETLRASTPRKLTALTWRTHGSSYNLDVEDIGIVSLERRKGSERACKYLYPGFVEELNSLVSSSGLEKHHGFFQRSEDWAQQFNLGITFDTRQRIEVIGHSGAGGTPEGFLEALVPLLRVMDDVMEPASTRALPPTMLRAFSFRVSGMVIGEDVRLYERMDKDASVLVLSRVTGYSSENRKDAVLDAVQLAELEQLLKKYDIHLWNGFNGRPSMEVLDGEGFSLSVDFRDGTRVNASGENSFPPGYHGFRSDLQLFADKILGSRE